MATYKVIQDIEAEDKFIGPLTLKQFIFAMFGALFAYLSFFVATKGLVWGAALTVPPSLFGFFMAVPWSSEQPTDVWVLAKIRFRLKPKKRIWDQAGLQELVTITAPKKDETPKTKSLSDTEVRSRLKALAGTIDSRGWIIKSASFQGLDEEPDDDRLVNPELLPSPIARADASTPDMMESEYGLDTMMAQKEQDRKARVLEKMDQARRSEPVEASGPAEPAVLPSDNSYTEQTASDQLKESKSTRGIATENMHTLPAAAATTQIQQDDDSNSDDAVEKNDSQAQKTEVEKAKASMTEPVVPDILELAGNNDLNISTIARQINNKDARSGPDEVVISLH